MATITAASANNTAAQPDVQNAVNLAANGDTVSVPAGTVTWTSPVTVTNKYISIVGAGYTQTIITDGLVRVNGVPRPITWTSIVGGLSRLSGFTFQGGTLTDGFNKGMVTFGGQSDSVRVDNNKFIPTKTHAIQFVGGVTGVFDHNIIDISSGAIPVYTQHHAWAGVGNYGDRSFYTATTLGTIGAMFYEDNTWLNDQTKAPFTYAIDGWQGSRVVIRHNVINNSSIQNHGTESGGRERSQRQFEIYDNTINWNGQGVAYPAVIAFRGGTGVVFNNTVNLTNGTLTAITDGVDYRNNPHTQIYPWSFAGKFTPTSIAHSGSIAILRSPERFPADAYHGALSFHGFPTPDYYIKIEGATGGDATLYNGIYKCRAWPSITSSSVANPTVITTSAAHYMTTGDTISIVNHVGSAPTINGIQVITVTGTNTFTIPVNVTTAGSGGTFGNRTALTYQMTGTPVSDATGTLVASSPWDGNADNTGYLVFDQIGAGQCDYISGDVPIPTGNTHQVSEPVYHWNNKTNGTTIDFHSSNNNTIQVNRDFFNSAKPSYTPYTYPHPLNLDTPPPPPPVPTTFGQTGVGASTWNSSLAVPLYSKFTAPNQSGTISKISAYVSDISGGSFAMGGAVYGDTAGVPGARLAVDSGDVTVTGATPAWYDITVSYAFTANQVLWLAIWPNSTHLSYSYESTGGNLNYDATATFETWPNPNTANNPSARLVSVYATYTAVASNLQPPTNMLNLTVGATTTTTQVLTWDAGSDAQGAITSSIEICSGSACVNFATYATGKTSPATLTGLTPNTTYRARGWHVDTDGNVSVIKSNIVQFTTSALPALIPPATPSGLAIGVTTSTNVTISWTANTESDLVGYKVYQSYIDGEFGSLVATLGISGAPQYTALVVIAGLVYLTVSAYDTDGNESLKAGQVSTTMVGVSAPTTAATRTAASTRSARV